MLFKGQLNIIIFQKIIIISLVVIFFNGIGYGALAVDDPIHGILTAAAPIPPTFPAVVDAIESYQPIGWEMKAPYVRIYANKPTNQVNISGVEDSSSLFEFGLKELIFQPFDNDSAQIMCKVFQFERPEGAYGAYTLLRKGASTVIIKGDASSEDDQNLSFWQDDFFVQISTKEEDNETKEIMHTLANKISAAIAKHANLPAIILRLPQLDRVLGSEKFIMGPQALKKTLTVPGVNGLLLSDVYMMATSEYQVKVSTPERLRLLLINYTDENSAFNSYHKYCSTLSAFHKTIKTDNSSLFKGKTTYLYCQVKGSYLAIIMGAHKKESSAFLAKQLDWLITN